MCMEVFSGHVAGGESQSEQASLAWLHRNAGKQHASGPRPMLHFPRPHLVQALAHRAERHGDRRALLQGRALPPEHAAPVRLLSAVPCQRCRMCALAALRTGIAPVTLRLATSERATNQSCASCNNVDAWIKSEFTLTSFYCTSCSPETAKAIATKFTYCC